MTSTTTTTAIRRQPAWRAAGRLITSSTGMTREEMLAAADLDWTVEQAQVTCAVPEPDGVRVHEFPKRRATIRRNRDGSTVALGIMGDGFAVLQNHEMFDTLEAIADVSGARYDSAGFIRDGAQVFAALTLPRTCTVGGRDDVDWYLLGRNGHDGSAAFTVAATPVRIRCTNMLRATFGNARRAGHTITVKHTRNARLRIDEARRALSMAFKYEDEWESWAASLLATPMPRAEFVQFLDRLVPEPVDVSTVTRERAARRRGDILSLWSGSTLENVTGTRWAAWNAVSEWEEWSRPVRGGDAPVEQVRAQRQIERGLGSLTERAGRLLSV